MLNETKTKSLPSYSILSSEAKLALVQAKIDRARAHSQALAEFAEVKAKSAERSLYSTSR